MIYEKFKFFVNLSLNLKKYRKIAPFYEVIQKQLTINDVSKKFVS